MAPWLKKHGLAAHARGSRAIAQMSQDVIYKGCICTGCAYMHSSVTQMHAAVWSWPVQCGKIPVTTLT